MILDDLWAELRPSLKQFKDDVDDLCDPMPQAHPDESIVSLHTSLMLMQNSLHNMSQLVANLALLRARAQRAHDTAQDEYDDRWREVMQQTRVGEYTSAQERNATYTSGSVEQLIKLRKIKRMYDEVKEIHEYARTRYEALDRTRRIVESRIRILNTEASLSR